jgi:hypothetical protein
MLRESILSRRVFSPDTKALQQVTSRFIEELLAPSVVVRATRPEPQAQHN